ncbi:MAG: hypothetical protein Q8K82_11995 [Gemmatimonadaceae bacterium]|nr:hypothetical protein [Gemmatimonadaceae bacterium]
MDFQSSGADFKDWNDPVRTVERAVVFPHDTPRTRGVGEPLPNGGELGDQRVVDQALHCAAVRLAVGEPLEEFARRREDGALEVMETVEGLLHDLLCWVS